MSSTRIRKSEPCSDEDCASRRFHIGDDGYTYCERGHRQSDRGTIIAEDTGEYVIYGTKSKRKDSDSESAVSRASSFSGPRAFDHYLLCVQLVLRKQLRWLIDVQKLPEELESLVRDLWALRLQNLQHRTTYDSETEVQSSQVFSSQSESASGTESRSSRRRRRKANDEKAQSPALVETLVLCYLGTILLRIPVTTADFLRWANAGNLLYYRAHREVPLGMRERLPGEFERQLEPQHLLNPQMLHQRIVECVAIFSNDFGIAFAGINTPLVLFRWMKVLSLPLEILIASQRLAAALNIRFAFDASSTDTVLRHPEACLMGLVVVATKLLHPFDDISRHPASPTDLSTCSMDWGEWIAAQELGADLQNPQLTLRQGFDFSEKDCIEAADEKLDSYLAWYKDNVASDEVRERGAAGKDADFRKALLATFSLDPQPDSQSIPSGAAADNVSSRRTRTLQKVQEKLVAREVVERDSSEEVARTGNSYRRFRAVEDLSGTAKVFYDRAAQVAGMSLDGLVHAVFLIERKLQKQEESLRKAAKS